jgi:hypothetical protein
MRLACRVVFYLSICVGHAGPSSHIVRQSQTWSQGAPADQGTPEIQKCFANICPLLIAHAQAAKLAELGKGLGEPVQQNEVDQLPDARFWPVT